MNVTETSAEGLTREYKITVPANELEQKISERLGEIGKAVHIPGFRPGKVPMQLLRKRYGQAVRGEVLESTLQGSSAEAVREHNLRPALPPRVEILSADEGADLEYKMSVEILPDMPEPDFAELGLERLITEVPDEDIDRALERLAESQRKAEPVERPAETGDIVVADVVGRSGDAEIPGSRGEGREIEIGGAGFLPGFSEQLVGASAGEQRTVRITFPEEYGNPDLAGKEGVFEIAVKEVRHRLPAQINDELAAAVGLETLAELRDEIRQRMRQDYDGVARQRLKRALLDKLAERYDFPVPPGMVEMEFQSIWSQYEAEKQRQKDAEAEQAAPSSDGSQPALDAAAVIAPEETPLEGAPDHEPMPAESEGSRQQHEAASTAGDEPQAHAQPAPDAPLDGSAVIAPEETALEGAPDAAAPADPAPAGAPAAGAPQADAPAADAPQAEGSQAEATADPPADGEDEKAKVEFRRMAERRVRLGLLLGEVGRKNNIAVTQEELNQALTREARRHPGYERQVIDYYRNNPEAINNLRGPIFEDKVIDFVVEMAKPNERRVTPQELMSEAMPPDAEAATADG